MSQFLLPQGNISYEHVSLHVDLHDLTKCYCHSPDMDIRDITGSDGLVVNMSAFGSSIELRPMITPMHGQSHD
jgi:hypothetical protein